MHRKNTDVKENPGEGGESIAFRGIPDPLGGARAFAKLCEVNNFLQIADSEPITERQAHGHSA